VGAAPRRRLCGARPRELAQHLVREFVNGVEVRQHLGVEHDSLGIFLEGVFEAQNQAARATDPAVKEAQGWFLADQTELLERRFRDLAAGTAW
jgi:hypothetical protein